jgi:excinuclease ABC subunit C
MTRKDYDAIAEQIPKNPGVYTFRDQDGTILYVGKAKNLKNRISSYFNAQGNSYNKTRVMVKNAHHLEYILVESEQDALLLENTLIKSNQPKYNVSLKDGKSYSYLCIKKEAFPRVFFTRKIIKDGSTYFGPYTSKWRMMQIMEIIRKIFPLRTCSLNLSPKGLSNNTYKVCLEYHIRNCNGPCEGFESSETYDERVAQIKNILKGNFGPVKEFIKVQMLYHAELLEFEKAQNWKDKLSLFEDYQSKSTVVSTTVSDVDVFSLVMDDDYAYVNYLKVSNGVLIHTYMLELKKNLSEDTETLLTYAIMHLREKFSSISPEVIVPFDISWSEHGVKILVPQKGDKLKLLELSVKNAQYHLQQKLMEHGKRTQKESSAERILRTLKEDLHMEVVPFHLECFDNSNLQGTNPVASCVVFKNARPATKDYRHFHIKTVEGPDDFASMEEVVYRRYRRLLDEEEALPQLIIIDGGKGQLNAAVRSLKKLDIYDRVTVIGIAKKLEEIYFPEDPIPLHINKKSESLKLIQQARNEAHRFAVSFHRTMRSKNAGKTALENIKGIGPVTTRKLMAQFGSLKGIKDAGFESWVSSVGQSVANRLKAHFDEQG